MERTESKIVQVAPDYENNKIQEQQTFGWNLQGRQEIHEEGDTEGGPDLIGNGYTTKTRINKYVKLHFVRSLEMPNINRIRELEDEYNSMERPQYPSLVPGGGFLLLFWSGAWLLIYLPFVFTRKKREANEVLFRLTEKYEEVSREIAALPN